MRGNAHLEYTPGFNDKWDKAGQCYNDEFAQRGKVDDEAIGLVYASEDHRTIVVVNGPGGLNVAADRSRSTFDLCIEALSNQRFD